MYATPDEAEEAFYAAFRQRDVGAMMSVWLDDDSVVCIHPMGERLRGVEEIRESWRQIFDTGHEIPITHSEVWRNQGPLLAVHVGHEHITPPDDDPAVVAVTNVYQLTETGWRMLLHHASPMHAGIGTPTATPTALH